MVRMPCGRVTSAQPFIITGGPIATTSSMSAWRAIACSRPAVTRPCRPALPSSVQTISSSHTAANLSCQNIRSRLRKPITPITFAPCSWYARACGNTGATPSPPPTQTTFFGLPMWLGMPIGPTSAYSEVPTWQSRRIACVVLPTAWITRVMVPRSRSKSASVSGMRSPCSSAITMTNCPGLAARAINGCSISSRKVTSEKSWRATTVKRLGPGVAFMVAVGWVDRSGCRVAARLPSAPAFQRVDGRGAAAASRRRLAAG